jgi:uncharacterized repeat protein (TIGR02543 family)
MTILVDANGQVSASYPGYLYDDNIPKPNRPPNNPFAYATDISGDYYSYAQFSGTAQSFGNSLTPEPASPGKWVAVAVLLSRDDFRVLVNGQLTFSQAGIGQLGNYNQDADYANFSNLFFYTIYKDNIQASYDSSNGFYTISGQTSYPPYTTFSGGQMLNFYGTGITPVVYKTVRLYPRSVTDAQIAALSTEQLAEAEALLPSGGVNIYTVNFDSQDGSAVPSQVTTGLVKRPDNPTREHYTFTGWVTEAEGSTAFDFGTPVESDTTVYATWTPVAYTLTFGTGTGSAVAPQTVNYGQQWTRPADPTLNNYTFTGWVTTVGGYTTAFDFGQTATGNRTAYATWTYTPPPPTEVTLTFDANGGTAVSPITVLEGTTFAVPTNTTKFGYYLQG